MRVDVPSGQAGWEEIWRFALTYNGYERAGDEVAGRIGNAVAEQYWSARTLPDDLHELRTALFFAQRAAHYQGDNPEGEEAEYVRALVRRIGELWSDEAAAIDDWADATAGRGGGSGRADDEEAMMQDAVVLFTEDGTKTELLARPYDVELELEEFLVCSPLLLAGLQMTPDDPRRWLLVRRQYPLRSRGGSGWSADILFLDHDGIPTIVEVKRADNRELRREVVGQVLDYAAALRYGSPAQIRDEYEARTAATDNPGEDLIELLNGGDVEEFWARVAENVSDGRIRLVIAADEIPPEVQAVTELLNEQLRTAEFFALAVTQYEADGLRVLVPRLAGATAAARTVKRPPTNGPGYLAALEEAGDAARDVAERLDAWAARRGLQHRDSAWARLWTTLSGRAVCRFYPREQSMVEVQLRELASLGPDAAAQELLAEFNALDPSRKLQGERLPSVRGSVVIAAWPRFAAALDRLVDQLEK